MNDRVAALKAGCELDICTMAAKTMNLNTGKGFLPDIGIIHRNKGIYFKFHGRGYFI